MLVHILLNAMCPSWTWVRKATSQSKSDTRPETLKIQWVHIVPNLMKKLIWREKKRYKQKTCLVISLRLIFIAGYYFHCHLHHHFVHHAQNFNEQ
jgi:hypothetical protein